MIIKPITPIWWTPTKKQPKPDKVYVCIKCERTSILLPQQGTCLYCGGRSFTVTDRTSV